MILKRIHVFDLELIGLLLFLLVLPFHLVVKKLLPPWGAYWKEMLLGALLILWIIRYLYQALKLRQRPYWLLIYLGLLVLRFILDGADWVGAWGLYISVMYLPLFWLVPAILRRHPDWTTSLIVLLVGVGGLIALGGLAEFVLDVPLWLSDELVQRQGFPDVFIYGTHVRRVYFTFDSPTALANTLALLLPLALMLILYPPRLWTRLVAGVAAVAMTACIIVTFSRGIWVSTLLALLVMALWSGLARPKCWILPAIGGGIALIILGWGLVNILRPGPAVAAGQGIIELAPTAYQTVPVVSVAQELLDSHPLGGQPVIQNWSLFDPITGQDDTRTVLYEHPAESGKAEIIYRISVPESGALRFAIALVPEVWSPEKGDGTNFKIHIVAPDTPTEGQTIFTRYINPKYNPSDRRWRNFLVDLSPWAGRTVQLSLITESGPNGDWAFDWGGWSELQLIRIEPDYFASAPAENVLMRHASSTLDWARDETNRDRLLAWSLGWDAWRTAPLWGNGLGSTGVAALHTNPEHAFVTESQALKVLVELGLPGLCALIYLWWQIARTGRLAYRFAETPISRALLLGLLTSLLVIFIEGWIYQNLEVKQVNAYFWFLVGALAFLSEQWRERHMFVSHHC
ncbi:MAG: O-antigen ligase family protein [Chloroflexi bacterium]|nr:O-antigen ligase family protein [Chloroflexota bacterium]